MSLTSSTSTEWAQLWSDFFNGVITKPELAEALQPLLEQLVTPAVLAEAIRAQMALFEDVIAAARFGNLRGSLSSYSDLPTGAAFGDIWIVDAFTLPTDDQQHAWLWLGYWKDLGKFRGPAGSTVVDFGFACNDTPPTAGEVIAFYGPSTTTTIVPSRCSVTLPAAANANAVFALYRGATQIGTVTFTTGSANGVLAFTTLPLPAKSRITAAMPAPLLANLAGMILTLSGDR